MNLQKLDPVKPISMFRSRIFQQQKFSILMSDIWTHENCMLFANNLLICCYTLTISFECRDTLQEDENYILFVKRLLICWYTLIDNFECLDTLQGGRSTDIVHTQSESNIDPSVHDGLIMRNCKPKLFFLNNLCDTRILTKHKKNNNPLTFRHPVVKNQVTMKCA